MVAGHAGSCSPGAEPAAAPGAVVRRAAPRSLGAGAAGAGHGGGRGPGGRRGALEGGAERGLRPQLLGQRRVPHPQLRALRDGASVAPPPALRRVRGGPVSGGQRWGRGGGGNASVPAAPDRRFLPPAGAASTPWWPTGTPSTSSAGTTGKATAGPWGAGRGRGASAEGSRPPPGLRGAGLPLAGSAAQHSRLSRSSPQEDDAERPAALRREGLLVVQVGCAVLAGLAPSLPARLLAGPGDASSLSNSGPGVKDCGVYRSIQGEASHHTPPYPVPKCCHS